MKNLTWGVFILAFAATPALAEPTLYGKANLSFQTADEGDESMTELKSNASRIGVKGDYKVDDKITAIYKAEFEVQFDDGDKEGETFSQRNIYLGLKGDFGTVKAGKFDTPLKTAQKKVDLFNDLEGDIKNVITVNDNRADNIVGYETPEFSNFKGNVAFVASEEDGVSDGISASVTYAVDALYVAAALDQNVESEDIDTLRLVAQYNIGDFQIGALYESMDDEAAEEDVDAIFVSVKYKMGDLALKAQLGSSDVVVEDGETLSIGADYTLAKNLKTFAYYTQSESDSVDGVDNDYLGVGIELKF
ncbi:MAG: porin [Agarilytica sp.]